jgi:hypothetical protein
VFDFMNSTTIQMNDFLEGLRGCPKCPEPR